MTTDVDLGTLWSSAGVIAGFPIGAFTWRITREIRLSDAGHPTWLPLADVLNLLSLALTLLGVFCALAIGMIQTSTALLIFGWSVVLLAFWPLAVAGHYELFNRKPRRRPAPYATPQERVVVGMAALTSLVYWIVVALN